MRVVGEFDITITVTACLPINIVFTFASLRPWRFKTTARAKAPAYCVPPTVRPSMRRVG